jgi:protoporphyrinogen oxidase
VCIDGHFAKYPIENDLAALKVEHRDTCLLDYLFNDHAQLAGNPADLEQWFLGVFGRGLTELYFRPYNEKIWKVPLAGLSMTWADRIPRPPAQDVVRGALGIPTEGYLHQLYFHYPRVGGYAAIPEAWAAMLPAGSIRLSCPVERIEPRSAGIDVVTPAGRERFDRLVSTMPLDLLAEVVDDVPASVAGAISRLTVNPMAVVSLGFCGLDEHEFSSVYFPATDFLVNRISSPGTFSPANCPPGHISIQAEITAAPGDPVLTRPDRFFVDHCIEGLRENRVIAEDHELVYSRVDRFSHAYVVYTPGYERDLEVVRAWAEANRIHLHGRFGSFEYLNVDGCVIRSRELASRLNRRQTDLPAVSIPPGTD